MRIFDCHSHFSTRDGLHHASLEDYENAQRVFKRKRTFQTEAEMAETFRSRGVRTILDIYRTWRLTDEDEIRASNDYAAGFARKNPDIVFGNWLAINPAMKAFWIKEYERLAASGAGFLGFCQSQNSLRYPPSDPIWDPFYELSIDANVPVLLMTGLTGIGQGQPGGKGIVLEDGHPRHVDLVAARFPEASRSWPGGRHGRGRMTCLPSSCTSRTSTTRCTAGRPSISRLRSRRRSAAVCRTASCSAGTGRR